MQALTVTPGMQDSLQLRELPDPLQEEGSVLVEAVAVGLCGTDREIVAGAYGQPPAGESFLVLGHENLGRVTDAPAGSGLSAGDLVVGIVRRPDPVPCPACARDEWDMCRNGQYTEHGIKGFHHAHLGTMIETVEDAEHLLAVAPNLWLLFDTGHLLAARSDPMAVFRSEHLRRRIGHVHLKDFHADDLAGWNHRTQRFGERARFAELGAAIVDTDAIAHEITAPSTGPLRSATTRPS